MDKFSPPDSPGEVLPGIYLFQADSDWYVELVLSSRDIANFEDQVQESISTVASETQTRILSIPDWTKDKLRVAKAMSFATHLVGSRMAQKPNVFDIDLNNPHWSLLKARQFSNDIEVIFRLIKAGNFQFSIR